MGRLLKITLLSLFVFVFGTWYLNVTDASRLYWEKVGPHVNETFNPDTHSSEVSQ